MKSLIKRLAIGTIRRCKFLPDKCFLRLRFLFEMDQFLHLNHPQTFQEKLQWLKIYDRNPLYVKLVDKSAVKKYVAEQIGHQHIIKTLFLWDSPKDIDITRLPDKFVMKVTHGGGGTM